MRDIPIDDGSSHPEGTLSADGHLEVRGGEWRETELGQVERWRRQAPDLYAAFMQQTEEKVQQAEARAAEREQHQREIADLIADRDFAVKRHADLQADLAQQAETIRQLQEQLDVCREMKTGYLARAEAAEARCATLTQALEQAKERAEIAKAFLHESGTDPEAWLDEAIAACAEALQGRETPDPQRGAPR